MARRTRLVTASFVLHVAAGFAIYLAAIWRLERLEAARPLYDGISIERPPSGGGSPPDLPKQQLNPKKPKEIPKEPVQPEPRVEPEPEVIATTETGDGESEGTGTGTGVGDGDGPGECAVPPCTGDPVTPPAPPPPPPAPPAPRPPRIIPPNVLTSLRIAGETQIMPGTPILQQMWRAKETRAVGAFEVCITETGSVFRVTLRSSTHYPAYDARLRAAMMDWRYRPFTIDGRGYAVCGMVTFIYHVPPAPPGF